MQSFLTFLISAILLLCVGLAHAENNLEDIEQNISDSIITTKITAKFANNHELNLLKIHVSTNHGIVTLNGFVNNKQAFVQALTLAKDTNGVNAVEEDLVIKKVNTTIIDAYITAKVETAILKAKVLDDESIPLVGINASTSNGTVTLSGYVKQDKSIFSIIKRVNTVRGVKKIISHLQINKDVS